TDYVQPNMALESGDLDANYFQHKPYLDQFNEQKGTDLVSAAAIHYEPFGIYAGKTDSIDKLADGAQIAVPNDVSNEARALLLLADQGLIGLKEGVELDATKNDIVKNDKNFKIVEVEAAQLPRSLGDVDVAVINGNYAIEAGLKVSDALAVEDAKSVAATLYSNIIAVRAGEESSEKTKALVEALTSDTVKKFIEDTYDGAVVPSF
ncbi:MAG: MetQ/NlpA family ABC transporter substrate-binding protein, partial [Lacrimispora sphenoides]